MQEPRRVASEELHDGFCNFSERGPEAWLAVVKGGAPTFSSVAGVQKNRRSYMGVARPSAIRRVSVRVMLVRRSDGLTQLARWNA